MIKVIHGKFEDFHGIWHWLGSLSNPDLVQDFLGALEYHCVDVELATDDTDYWCRNSGEPEYEEVNLDNAHGMFLMLQYLEDKEIELEEVPDEKVCGES